MLRAILFAVFWSLTTAAPAVATPANDAPAPKPAIVLIIAPNARQSEVVKQVVEALEKAGIAKADSPDKVTPSTSAIHVALSLRADESFEKIKSLVEALQAAGVEQLSFQAGGVQEAGKEAQNHIRLIAQPNSTAEELHRIEQAIINSAKQSGLMFVVSTQIPGQENAPANDPSTTTAPAPVKHIEYTETLPDASSREKDHQLAEAVATALRIKGVSIESVGIQIEVQDGACTLTWKLGIPEEGTGTLLEELVRKVPGIKSVQHKPPARKSPEALDPAARGSEVTSPSSSISIDPPGGLTAPDSLIGTWLIQEELLYTRDRGPISPTKDRMERMKFFQRGDELRVEFNVDDHVFSGRVILGVQGEGDQKNRTITIYDLNKDHPDDFKEATFTTMRGVYRFAINNPEEKKVVGLAMLFAMDCFEPTGTYPRSLSDTKKDRIALSLVRSLPPQQASQEKSPELKVFALKYAQAAEVADVLKQVYDKGPSKIVPDARTNSVIVTGPEAQLEEIEALLLKLDEGGPANPNARSVPVDPTQSEAAKLVVQLEDELAQVQQSVGENHPKVKELQGRIAAARQNVQPDAASRSSATPATNVAPLGEIEHLDAEGERLRQRLEADKKNLDRSQALMKEGVISAQNAQEAEAPVRVTEALLAAHEAQRSAVLQKFKAQLLKALDDALEYFQSSGQIEKAELQDAEKQIEAIITQVDTSPQQALTAANDLISQLDSELVKQLEKAIKSSPTDPQIGTWQTALRQAQRRARTRKLLPGSLLSDRDFLDGAKALSSTESVAWTSIVNEIISELEKEREAEIERNLGKHSPRVDDLNAFIAQIKAANADHFATAANEQAKAIAELKETDSLFSASLAKGRAEREQLLTTDPTNPRIRELDEEIATVTVMQRNYAKAIAAAEAGAGSKLPESAPLGRIVSEGSPQELQQQIAQLRKEYEAADSEARQLARQLQTTPDEARKNEALRADLRRAVQRTFTARQSLLRAELLEMHDKLLKTQRSIDLRERISDQIIQRRVEDLLNPQLEWDGSPEGERVGKITRPSPAFSDEAPDALGVHILADRNENGMVAVTFQPSPHSTLERLSVGQKVVVSQTLRPIMPGYSHTPIIVSGCILKEFWANRQRAASNQPVVLLVRAGDEKRLIEAGQVGALEVHAENPEPRKPRHPVTQGFRRSIPVEYDHGIAVAESSSRSNDLLSQLQGTWDVELSATDLADQPPGTRAEVTIEGNLLKLWEIVPPQPGLTTEMTRTEAGAMLLTVGAAGPPQQVDLVIEPSGDKRRETQGIIEIAGATVKLCYDPLNAGGEARRPAAFAVGERADLFTLKRRPHTPETLSKISGAQKQKWRSAIVQIFTEWTTEEGTQQRPTGFGVVVSDQGDIIAQIGQVSSQSRRYYAFCDDGSQISLEMTEEAQLGWSVFRPLSTTQFNHTIPRASREPEVEDEVWFYEKSLNDPTRATLAAKDRAFVALGLPTWQVAPMDNGREASTSRGGLPVLNGAGELLGLSIDDTGAVSLVLPFSQFPRIFPKTFGAALP